MFESRLVDAFSRTHWSIVPILYVPAALVLLYLSVTRGGVGLGTSLALAVAGFVTWTLTEYWLHRTFFHWHPDTTWGPRLHFLVHGVHHTWPRDKYRLVMPPAVSVSLFWIFLGLWLLIFGRFGWACHAGFTLGYLFYDSMHYYIHHGHPTAPWLKALRKNHLQHHGKRYAHLRFGVSTTVWDHVFGTREPGDAAA